MTLRTDVAPEAIEAYRRELTGYCYRMLGTGSEAEDAVQETIVRAWRAADRFEGRSSLRSWLYRIATNVCIDMMRSSQRRALPMDLGPASPPEERYLGTPRADGWVLPIADAKIGLDAGRDDPAEIAAARDSVRLAFVAALQYLPGRQRAVLVLFEVLRWPAAEVAELLGTSVPAINSALQRARATLAKVQAAAPVAAGEATFAPAWSDKGAGPDDDELLARFVDAFERYDIDTLVTLLHEDAIQSMPPFPIWLRGRDDIAAWMTGPGLDCAGSRLVPTRANGRPAFGQYRVDPDGGHTPFGLHVLEITDGRIAEMLSFIDPALFESFGLPTHLP